MFTSDQTHGFSKADFSEVSLTSNGLGWTSAFVSRQKENPYQRHFAACSDPLVSFVLNGPIPFSRTVNGVSLERKFLPGSFGIVPATAELDARADLPLESMQIYIRQGIIEEIAGELTRGDPSRIEIIPQFAVFDDLLEELATAICASARNPPPSSSLYVDHLARAFAARLIVNHSTAELTAESRSQGLSRRQLDRVKDYIEAKLQAPLSLPDLAKVSELSPSHFARLFKESTGLTPYQYVLRCRIARAKLLLSKTSVSIAQIALDCGFGDQTHLTRAFSRMTGMTPANFRRSVV